MILRTTKVPGEVALEAGPHRITFATGDDHSRRWFDGNCADGDVHERAATERLLRFLTPEAVFADVGAHLGWFTCVAAPFARFVHAFEANPRVVPLLEENVARNRFRSKVRVHAVAAADSAGFVAFPSRGTKPGERIGRGDAQIPTVALDDVFAAPAVGRVDDSPALFKIDVEGAEGRVLRGMRGILERRRPALLLEIHPGKMFELGTDPREVDAILDAFGYIREPVGMQGGNRLVWATSAVPVTR